MAKKKIKEPTGREMRAFARKFDQKQWKVLQESKSFIEAILVDIKKAELIAFRILSGTYEEPGAPKSQPPRYRSYYDE